MPRQIIKGEILLWLLKSMIFIYFDSLKLYTDNLVANSLWTRLVLIFDR
jgi:hypothetical protein